MKEQFSNSQIINASESEESERPTASGLPSNSRSFITHSQDSNLNTSNKSVNHELYGNSFSVSDTPEVFELNAEITQNDVPCESLRKNRLNLEIQINIGVTSPTPKPKKKVRFMKVDEESANQLFSIKEESVSQLRSPAIPSTVFDKKKTPHLKLSKDTSVTSDHILEKPIIEINDKKSREEKENVRKSLDRNVMCIKKQKSYQNRKDGIRPLVSKCSPEANEHNKLKSFCKQFAQSFSIFVLSTILVLLISVFVYKNQDLKHSNAFANIAVELYQWIYGQDESIHTLCKYLQSDMPSRRVIAFIGGTGVGKSYTVEIIKKIFVRTFAFNHKYLAREYALRQCFSPIGIVKKSDVPLSHSNLIIMENLREYKLTDVISFLNELQDLYENRPITILAVFNITEMDDVYEPSTYIFESIDVIENSLIKIRTYVKIIPYYYLNEDVLTKCIMDAEKANKLTFTKKQFNHIKLLRNNMPCKRVYGKVRAIGRTILRNSS